MDDNTVSCENERDHKEGDDADEKEEKSLEKVIEEKLEEELSVEVDVRRKGPILWISTGAQLQWSIFSSGPEESQRWGFLSTYIGACCCCCGQNQTYSTISQKSIFI